MTIEQMTSIAKDKMNADISSLAHEVLGTLSAFKSVGLVTDVEYCDYMIRIRQTEHKRISQSDF